MRLLSAIIYFLAYKLAGYRKAVVRRNLEKSFPSMDTAERRSIERRYYHHMSDLLVEGIHNLFASPQSTMRHYRVVNRDILRPYYEQGRSVVLVSAHYNNWEYMVTSLNMQFLHHGIGVGKPLQDKLTAGFLTRRRTRFGTQVVDQRDVRQHVDFYMRHRVPCALMMLSDQSPSNPEKSYWTRFLHQDTAFLYGAEYFARKYNLPVFYYTVSKPRRFHYEVTLSPLCLEPLQEPQYTIVERYVRRLERQIEDRPEYWLWSHRRWKLTPPVAQTIKQSDNQAIKQSDNQTIKQSDNPETKQ